MEPLISKTDKLKPEFKSKWVAALRSGDYKQTTSCLCEKLSDVKKPLEDNSYCCLGVGCSILGINDEVLMRCGTPNQILDHSDKDYGKLPRLFKTPNYEGSVLWYLINLNDTYQKSFDEIANWIEENL